MARRIRVHDWAATPLGPIEDWSDRLKLMVEQMLASPLVSSLVCSPGRVLIYNDAAARLYGERHPAALGRPLPQTFPEGWATVAPLYARAFAGESVQVAALPLDTRGEGDPASDIFDAVLVPMREADGRVAFVHMTGFEVGGRVRAEAALRESEARLAAVFETLPVGIGVVGAQGGFVLANPEMRRFAPTAVAPSRDEARRSRWRSWHPDGRRVAPQDFPDARALRGERVIPGIEMLYTDDEGREVWTKVAAAPLPGPNGDTAGGVAVVADVDALKRVEAELRRSEARLAADLAGMRRLYGLHARLASETDLKAALSEIIAAACEFTRTDRGCVHLAGGEGGHLEMFAWRGHAEDGPFVTRFRHGDFGVGGDASPARRQRLIVEDVSIFPGLAATEAGVAVLADGIRAAQSTPMVSRTGEVMGVLGTQYRQPHRPGEDELRLIDLLAWIAADFVESHRAQAALRATEERLRQFGEASSEVLWIRDAGTLRWEYLSPAFEAIYGVGRDAALAGEGLRTWIDLIHEEDREHAVASIARVREGDQVTFEYRVRRPDGEVRWLRDTDFPMRDAQGRVQRIGGVGQDVTGLKRAEAALRDSESRLRTLTEGMPQLVWRSADGGQWTWASPQWRACTGQTRGEPLGLGWLDAVHSDDRGRTMQAWADVGTLGRLDVEHRLRRASDGAYLWHRTRALPVRGASGEVVEWLGTTTDVQQLKELQERQAVMVAELQHRTRNLLGVVRSLAAKTLGRGEPVRNFEDRLMALSRVQGQLSRTDGGQADLEALVRAELEVHVAIGPPKTIVRGPQVTLTAQQVQTFALALHELATNAVKYGALRQGDVEGRLSVTWQVEGRGGEGGPAESFLVLDWAETGVDVRSAKVTRSGYGRELIERALTYALKARTSYALGEDGVRCRIELPLSRDR